MSSTVQDLQVAAGLPAVASQPLTSISVQEQQAVARVKLQFYVAKTHPRDVNARLAEIKKLCAIPEVAADSEYSFPRGGQTVRGPNIRLAELIASNWHNFDYGLCEINRGQGSSLCEAYAIDMEANTAYRIQFNVPHRRDKSDRDGGQGTVDLKSDRDIYEMMANMGSRRLREAIFRVVPSFVVNAAVDACRVTSEKAAKAEPLKDRIPKAVAAWEKLGVTASMIAGWLKCPVNDMLEQQYQDLLVIYRTIKNHEGRIDDYFERDAGAPKAKTVVAGGDGKAAAGSTPAQNAKQSPDDGADKGGNAQSAPVAPSNAAPDAGTEPQGGVPAGEGAGDPTTVKEFEAAIAAAKTPDAIDLLSSLLNDSQLSKAEKAPLRSKLKARAGQFNLE